MKYSDVVVRLSGEDGNAFSIIARVTRALKRAGYVDEAEEFASQAMDCTSHEGLIAFVMETVSVE